jgi:hypothetical protein
MSTPDAVEGIVTLNCAGHIDAGCGTDHAAAVNCRHLISRKTLRQFRNEAMKQWRQAAAAA